jgi:BNR repeat protein
MTTLRGWLSRVALSSRRPWLDDRLKNEIELHLDMATNENIARGMLPVTTEGHSQYDQRIAVDANGTVYISYMDRDTDGRGRSITRLRLARSRDNGRTFSVETVTSEHVSDKPELAVSGDGQHLYIVYESSPGPRLVASHDAGRTWEEPRVVRQSEGRHFWPTALAVAPNGSVWFAVPSMSGSDIANRQQTPAQLHIFRSQDRGVTWDDFDMGSSPRFVNDCAHDPKCRVKAPDVMLAVDSRNRAFVTYMKGDGPRQPYGLFLRSSADSGRTWSPPQIVSAAPRPQSQDTADHDFPMIATSGAERLCVVWVDDRRGAFDVWARCSTDGARTFGADVLLSDRGDGASYKSPVGVQGVLRPLRRRGDR